NSGSEPANLNNKQFFGTLSSSPGLALYEERPIFENPRQNFTPSVANAALTSFHGITQAEFNSISNGLFTPWSILETDVAIPAAAAFGVDLAALLPEIHSLTPVGSASQPGVQFTASGAPTHLSTSKLGMLVFETVPVAGFTCVSGGSGVQWAVSFPSTGPVGSNTLCDGGADHPCLKFDSQ